MWNPIQTDGGGWERRPEPTGAEPTVSDWVWEKLGFEPDGVQRRLLDSTGNRVILNCTRQWGKSTITAAKAVHHALTRPESLTLAVSPSGRQSGEFVRKAEQFARRLKLTVRGDGDNEMSVAFPNGSRLVGLPGNESTVRGFSAVSLLLVDEASRVSEDLYGAVRPMLAVTDGALWLLSTPFGKRGFFYETWAHGGPEWVRAQVPATECPRIRKKFLEDERRSMGERHFRQEYLCEFVDSVCAVFDRDLVERAISSDVKPLRIP